MGWKAGAVAFNVDPVVPFVPLTCFVWPLVRLFVSVTAVGAMFCNDVCSLTMLIEYPRPVEISKCDIQKVGKKREKLAHPRIVFKIGFVHFFLSL